MPLEFTDKEQPQLVDNAVCWHGFREVGLPINCTAAPDAIKALSSKGTIKIDPVSIFNEHRRLFERVASKKYDAHDVTENNEVVVSAADIAKYQRG